jgi:hypothetical protein
MFSRLFFCQRLPRALPPPFAQALSAKEPKPHVPFRDSTLTRLLQPALSGPHADATLFKTSIQTVTLVISLIAAVPLI